MMAENRKMRLRQWRRTLALIGVLFLYTPSVRAEFNRSTYGDVGGNAQDQAVNAFIQRFTNFTQNKDVMGRMKTPDGKVQQKAPKISFNPDDAVSFQSDLTYHDKAFNDIVKEDTGKTDKNGKAETKESTLFAFVSPHGAATAAGGSSALERAGYQTAKQFEKQDEDPKNNKDDDKNGIKYRSMFKIETQEVFNDKNGGGGGNGGGSGSGNAKNGKQEPDKVERTTIREEARPAIEKVGEDSYKNEVARAAKDNGYQDDPNTLPNMTLLYEAAGRAAQSMWNTTLARLGQRRFFKGIQKGALQETPQLWEDTPTIQSWTQKVNGAIAKVAQNDPQQQKALQEDVQRMSKQGQQLGGVRWDQIDPRFETPDKNGGGGGGGGGGNQPPQEQLVMKGPAKEDSFQRDMRVQLSVLDKAGTDPSKVPSNWKYNPKDNQSTLATYDDSGTETGKRQVTPQEQIQSYNQQLQDAAKGMEEIQTRYPSYKADTQATLGYQIAPNTRSVMDIDRPTETMMEELGAGQAPAPKMATTYDDLVKTKGEAQ